LDTDKADGRRNLAALVTLGKHGFEVVFQGLWTRNDIDTAHRVMIRQLMIDNAKAVQLKKQNETKSEADVVAVVVPEATEEKVNG